MFYFKCRPLNSHWNVNSTIEKTVRPEDRLVCDEREEGRGLLWRDIPSCVSINIFVK